jgi:hypothetical protein
VHAKIASGSQMLAYLKKGISEFQKNLECFFTYTYYLDTYSCNFFLENRIVCDLQKQTKCSSSTIMIGFLLSKEYKFLFSLFCVGYVRWYFALNIPVSTKSGSDKNTASEIKVYTIGFLKEKRNFVVINHLWSPS